VSGRDHEFAAGPAERADQFTLALVTDVVEVLSRHGYPAPTGDRLVDLTLALHRALHPIPFDPFQSLATDLD
jgi:hypothetical protein